MQGVKVRATGRVQTPRGRCAPTHISWAQQKLRNMRLVSRWNHGSRCKCAARLTQPVVVSAACIAPSSRRMAMSEQVKTRERARHGRTRRELPSLGLGDTQCHELPQRGRGAGCADQTVHEDRRDG